MKSCLSVEDAVSIRNEMEQFAQRHFFHLTLAGLCAITSEYLYRYATNLNIPATFVVGQYDYNYHAWVESQNYIYDLTATQFKNPPIVICPVSGQTTVYNNRLYVPFWKGNAALKDLKNWPESQKMDFYPRSEFSKLQWLSA